MNPFNKLSVLLLGYLLFNFSLAGPAADVSLEIKTSIGTFRGTRNVTEGLEMWKGVPFARPPVGKLRFRAPQTIMTPFSGVVDASSFGGACPQPVVYFHPMHSIF